MRTRNNRIVFYLNDEELAALTDKVQKSKIPAGEVHPYHTRQQTNHGDAAGGLQTSCAFKAHR